MIKDNSDASKNTPWKLPLIVGAGLCFGLVAQVLRQIDEPLMTLGAATAPWLTVGFVLSLWATRPPTSAMSPRSVGIAAMGFHLFAWLLAYHSLFAIRESITAAEAWREAAPWVMVAIPASVVPGVVAGSAHGSSVLRAVCLALPIAWSLPEIAMPTGSWGQVATLTLPTVGLLVLPFLMLDIGRRDLARAGVAVAALGALSLAAFPILRSFVRS